MEHAFTVIGVVQLALSDIRSGAHVFIPAQQHADGTVTVARALVGKDGVVPPM
jgi:hypothetical protein